MFRMIKTYTQPKHNYSLREHLLSWFLEIRYFHMLQSFSLFWKYFISELYFIVFYVSLPRQIQKYWDQI